ncbi:MAG: oxidoreductase [Rhodospirillales bacterium]|nr:oxidoreductase [Rhodospirillales bacterium]
MTYETDDILSFVLVDPQGRDLPEFAAGAHLDVHIAEGLVRQYSLSGDPADRSCYEIAVLNERSGRGGSKALHETARPGRIITVSVPRNHFPLADEAKRHLLLAGGIGVTPMMAMIAALEARGADWRMHYCTRSANKTAFLDRLKPFIDAGKVILHYDGGDPKKGLDIPATLKDAEAGTHLYYCGPSGFMAAVADAARHWPDGSVHFEFFNSPGARPAEIRVNTPFQVKLKSTGEVLDVPADKSIVQVLRDKGHVVDTSCEEGFCGTCLTRYIEGEPEHRDSVLDADDRAQYVLICCARSNSPLLVLDI